jgi:hypothetical protein
MEKMINIPCSEHEQLLSQQEELAKLRSTVRRLRVVRFIDKILIMRNILLIFITVCMISLSCTENKIQKVSNPDLHVIDMDMAELITKMKTSQLFKKVKPIILEVTPNSLLRGIDRIYVTNELLIIMDRSTSSVFVFDREGKFLHKIGNRGQGPGEYVSVSDFGVDTVNKTIYLSDYHTRKIHHYDLYSGKHLKSIKLNTNIENWYLYYYDNDLYISCDNDFQDKNQEGFLLHKIDINSGKTKETWFDFRVYNKGLNNCKRPFLHTSQNDMKFTTHLMDTIMSISGNKITPFLTFTDKYKTTNDDLKDIDDSSEDSNERFRSRMNSLNKINTVYNYFESPDFFFMQFYLGIDLETILYDPKTKHVKRIGYFIDDLVYSNQKWSMPMFIAADKKGIYAYIHTMFINTFIETRDNGGLSLSMSNNPEIQQLDYDANPLIFYYEFKDE